VTQMFSGVRIIELAQYVMVPAAGVMLADLGAEVIKVETPGVGDPYRALVVDNRAQSAPNYSLEMNNRGKKSVAINLKDEAGKHIFLDLIRTADVFLTSLRPRALKALRLDPDSLRAANPRLIYARGNGFGFKGDEADRPGFDASAFWARGGFPAILKPASGEFIRQPRALGDHAASSNLAFAIAGALFQRERTGEGAVVETSLLSTALWLLSNDVVAGQDGDYPEDILIKAVERNPLVGQYRSRDGRWIQLVFLEPDRFWPGLCRALEREDLLSDPRFHDARARAANGRDCIALLSEIFGSRDWSEWQPGFAGFDAPWELVGDIRTLPRDPQVAANDYVFDLDLDEGRKVMLVASPVTVDGASGKAARRAPHCGEQSEAVFAELGLSEAEMETLRARGAIA